MGTVSQIRIQTQGMMIIFVSYPPNPFREQERKILNSRNITSQQKMHHRPHCHFGLAGLMRCMIRIHFLEELQVPSYFSAPFYFTWLLNCSKLNLCYSTFICNFFLGHAGKLLISLYYREISPVMSKYKSVQLWVKCMYDLELSSWQICGDK